MLELLDFTEALLITSLLELFLFTLLELGWLWLIASNPFLEVLVFIEALLIAFDLSLLEVVPLEFIWLEIFDLLLSLLDALLKASFLLLSVLFLISPFTSSSF